MIAAMRRNRPGLGLGLILVLLAVSVSLSLSARSRAQPEAARKPDPLAKQRLEIAKKVYDRLQEELKNPPANGIPLQEMRFGVWIERIVDWSGRWMRAERQAAETRAAEIQAIQAHIARLKSWEDQLQELIRAAVLGWSSPNLIDRLSYERLEAESLLAQVKAETP
jgi:hypothetical protein